MSNPHSQQKTTEQMLEAIFEMDLDPIKFKLMEKEGGQNWTRAEADRLELEYRRFLALSAKFPDEMIVPDADVDKFWHGHILDTMKYAQDCQQVFGYFLHHFPYSGLRDDDDAASHTDAVANTRRLYQQEFGSTQKNDVASGADVGEAAYCARVAGAENAAYCARVAGAENAAYCARVAGAENAAYCARVVGAENAAYCARVAGAENAAYCARVAGGKNAAYGDVTNARYAQTLLSKGRPTLESVA